MQWMIFRINVASFGKAVVGKKAQELSPPKRYEQNLDLSSEGPWPVTTNAKSIVELQTLG